MNPSRPSLKRISSLLSMLLLLAPANALAQSGQKPVPKPPPAPDPFVRMNESIDALTKKVWPSVVQILVSSYGARRGRAGDGTSSSAGSGRPAPGS